MPLLPVPQFKKLLASGTSQRVVNVLKGAVHAFYTAALFAGGDAVLNYFGTLHVSNQLTAATMAFIMPFAYNAWREFKTSRGQTNAAMTNPQIPIPPTQ